MSRKSGRNEGEASVVRAGTVAIIGRSNVGKSTLLNAALELPLAVVSRRPQTTRTPLLGIVRHGDAEIGFLDTPGLHKAESRLGREMNRSARDAVRDADVILFVIALPPTVKGDVRPHPGDLALLRDLPSDKPVVLVVNKIDTLRDKRLMLPLLSTLSQSFADSGGSESTAERRFAAVVPVSARTVDGVDRVLEEVARVLPEGGPRHDEDALTDRPMRHFAAEYVREAILRATSDEVPHAVAVTIDEYIEPSREGEVTRVSATIHVEREGQKRILIGEKGAMLKRIGIEARARIEALVGSQLHLALWVRVTEDWRERTESLADFGLLARAERT
ncbi:MAG: GTPase Era [Deltaproteobacteria bacterium]|nr:GTPase Era [Deltaproteobacteria bacterium]